MAVVNQQAKEAAKSQPASNSTNRKKAETVEATPDQESSFEIQLQQAQAATQQGLMAVAQSNSDVLSSQIIQLTQNLTSLKVVKGVASIFEGDSNVTEVTTAFLFGTPMSGFQIGHAIAKLKPTQPLLLQTIGMTQPQLQASGSTDAPCLLPSNAVTALSSD
jgi:hypothetical protein